jgi:hypothetical protein
MKAAGIIITAVTLLIGIALMAVPVNYEGQLLLYINEQHGIRLVDAIGLILVIPSWFYLNCIGLKRLLEALQKRKTIRNTRNHSIYDKR